jgi:DNA-binding transcriptional ArsR family regulator
VKGNQSPNPPKSPRCKGNDFHRITTGISPIFDQSPPNYIQEIECLVGHAMDSYHQSAELLKAIAHPERLRLLIALREGEQCVCHLTALLGQRQPYVSQQLGYLREAGLTSDRKEGLRVYYRIQDPRVFQLLDAVGALVGKKGWLRERRTRHRALAACPCPRCAPS